MTNGPTLCVVKDCYIRGRHAQDCGDGDCNGCLPGLATDGLLTCQWHLEHGKRALRELPRLDRDLIEASVRRTGMVTEYINVKSESVGIILDQHVMDAKDAVRSRLADLCAYIVHERGVSIPRVNTLEMCVFLTRHAEWLSADKWAAPTWANTVHRVHQEARRAAYRTRPSGVYLGDCPVEVDDAEQCGAPVRHDPSQYAGDDVTCKKCGTTGTVEWWRTAMTPDPSSSPLMTAQQLVPVIAWEAHKAVTESVVRAWAARGHISRHGSDTKGRVLYQRAAVVEYAKSGTKEDVDAGDVA